MEKTYQHVDFSSGDTCFTQMPMNYQNTQKKCNPNYCNDTYTFKFTP